MADKMTAEHALAELDEFSAEWVDKDLEKGIAIPFRHWRNGQQKEKISLLLWKNAIVPLLFTIFVITCAKIGEWKWFAIVFSCYIIYWIFFALIKRREDASFILKSDGITIVTTKDKVFFPWEAIREIKTNTIHNLGYKLVIQVGNQYYTFYEVYPQKQVTDQNGQLNPAMMPLHVAYTVLKAAQRKVMN